MDRAEYVARAVARRPPSIESGILGVLGAALVFWIDSGFWSTAIERLSLFDMGTEIYRRAQWASTTSLFAFVAACSSLGVWLLGSSMRDFFGLPGRETPEWLLKLTPLRVLVSFVLFICLATWALDEILVRRVEWAPVGSLVIGLVITANFAWDMPRLFVDGRAALRARLPILRIPIATLGALPSSGRVRVRGRITGALADRAQPIEEGERGIVYQRRLGSVGDPIEKIVVPFLVEADGAQAIVDPRAGAPIVEAVEVSAPPLFYTRLRVGDRIEVIGNVQGGGDGDAYRSGMPRISAGPDDEPLLVFANADSMHRRLVIAAVVELVCAALLCACVVGLVVAWVGLRMIAHPELHKLASLGA